MRFEGSQDLFYSALIRCINDYCAARSLYPSQAPGNGSGVTWEAEGARECAGEGFTEFATGKEQTDSIGLGGVPAGRGSGVPRGLGPGPAVIRTGG